MQSSGPGSTSSTRRLAIPIDDVAQGVYAKQASGAVLAVIAFGPKAFDDEALQSAKVDVPPDTTVVWLFQVQT